MILMKKIDTIRWIFIGQSTGHSVNSICFFNALAVLWNKSMEYRIDKLDAKY